MFQIKVVVKFYKNLAGGKLSFISVVQGSIANGGNRWGISMNSREELI